MKLVTCPPSPAPYHLSLSRFIYRPQLTGREKMATAGSRHVMESYREVNDRLAVIPEAMMDIGHTHIYLLTTHACMHTRTQRRMWVMHVTLSVSDKPGQSGKTRPRCVISNWHMNMCRRAGWLLLLHWWVLGVCVCLCVTKHHHLAWYSPQYSPKAL